MKNDGWLELSDGPFYRLPVEKIDGVPVHTVVGLRRLGSGIEPGGDGIVARQETLQQMAAGKAGGAGDEWNPAAVHERPRRYCAS
jgi:hypothetical protein